MTLNCLASSQLKFKETHFSTSSTGYRNTRSGFLSAVSVSPLWPHVGLALLHVQSWVPQRQGPSSHKGDKDLVKRRNDILGNIRDLQLCTEQLDQPRAPSRSQVVLHGWRSKAGSVPVTGL